MQALIVDDEPPARNLLREYVEDEYPDIEIIATCGTGRAAVAAINEHVPDLVFLDVQMPGLDGFDVLERLDVLPHLIFSTAHDAYALQAFDAGAVDYLLKPYTRARFRKAVDRVRDRFTEQAAPGDGYAEQLTTLLRAARSEGRPPERLYVQHGSKIIPVPTDTILHIEAAGDYSKLHTADDTYLSNQGIGALEEQLAGDRFMRVHRSSIIALPAVDHLVSDGSGGYVAVLTGPRRVRVSRTYASRVRNLIQ
ncbi:MAG: response regulator [Bacteroidetes bacterium]|nr:response regulator [Bacteroidota bacterium]